MTDPSEERPDGFEVTRFIPVPNSVSARAQQFLAMGFAMGGDAEPGEPDRNDIDGWRAMIKASDEGLIAVMATLPNAVALAVETMPVGDVPVFVLTPEGIPDRADQPIYLDIHGGALVMGGGEACLALARQSAAMVRMRTWSVDYRMPPDHRYPAALDDCIAVYQRLLEVQPPERIVVGGGSAGGNLAAALDAARTRRRPPVARGPRAVDAGSGSHRVGRLVQDQPRHRPRAAVEPVGVDRAVRR